MPQSTPRTRPDRRSLRTLAATWQVPDPMAGVLIFDVRKFNANTVIWRFSSTFDGGGPCPQLMVNDGVHGWTSPSFVDAPDEYSIRASYPGAVLNLASMWQLLAQIDDVTFADGPLIVPQGGTLVA